MPLGPYLILRDERRSEMCASVMLLQSFMVIAYIAGSTGSSESVPMSWDATE